MSAVARRDSADFSDSQDIERNSTNDEPESDYDSAGSESEHSEQDPESQETERRVDDDEDRSNPQYIPKRGTFYEHDDRTAASGEEPARALSETSSEKKEGSPPPERRRPPRKSEVIDRWTHDKYNENEQAPKSRDELVAIYGYDIRNEDAPPHARRNRRYGRGPNKYTRTWEDEEAYRRQAAAAPRKPPNPEEFPDLDTANKHGSRKSRAPRPRSRSQPTSTESLNANANVNVNVNGAPRRPAPRTPRPARPRPGPGQPADNKLPPIENLTITATLTNNQSQPQRKVTPVAQQRPVPTEQGKKKPVPPQQPAAPQSPAAPPQKPAPAPAPPAQQPAGAETRGSKRYSSLRQRPLAEIYAPQQQQPTQPQQQQQQQQQQPQMRYHPEYSGAAPAAGPPPGAALHAQQLLHPVHRAPPPHTNLPAPAPAQHSQQVRLGMVEQQQMMPHPHHSMHNMPPQQHSMAAAPIQQAQGYAPPAMMPAQYMQGGGNGAVFGGAAMYAAPQPYQHPHPLYQHHNYATTAGGVTYYSPVEHEPPAPPALRAPRRPTAAIPIVKPDRPANSSEKDNIDRIVENMFVRKPWPGTQPNPENGSKDTESRNSQEPQSKESSQPNSLTSSSISTDSKEKERSEPEAREEDKKPEVKEEKPESIADA